MQQTARYTLRGEVPESIGGVFGGALLGGGVFGGAFSHVLPF